MYDPEFFNVKCITFEINSKCFENASSFYEKPDLQFDSPTGVSHLTSRLTNVDGYNFPHPNEELIALFVSSLSCERGFTLWGFLKYHVSTGIYGLWSPYYGGPLLVSLPLPIEASRRLRSQPAFLFPSSAVNVLCGNQNLLRGVNCSVMKNVFVDTRNLAHDTQNYFCAIPFSGSCSSFSGVLRQVVTSLLVCFCPHTTSSVFLLISSSLACSLSSS